MAAARQPIWCVVCGVALPSVSLLPTHNKGKKHQRFLKLRNERESSCRKSIYVRGFQNSGCIEDELTEYFNAYGKVSNVFLDKDKGVFAIVEFTDEETVSRVLHEESLPLLNGKRLTVKERTLNKASLQSKTPTSKKRKPNNDSQPHPHGHWQSREVATFVPDETVNELKSSTYTVQQELNLLMQQLCLTEEDVELRRLVCQLLQEVFHEVHSGASVVPFGSTVSGVGWKGSDLDVCLLTGDDCDTDVDYSEVINVLRSFAPGCVNIIPVLGAKCPLIKFKHQPSGLSCDLSVNNRLGVANSNLLHSYVSLDPRVSQLVFVVRAWAKAKGLTVGRQLGSYALTLMVLYFLQTRSPPVIPSLQQGFSSWIKEDDLHSTNDICGFDKLGSSQLEPELIDNWDCSFLRDTSKLAPSLNTESLNQLLEGFFFFFSTEFDFSNSVVSVRTGCMITIASVLDELKGANCVETDAFSTCSSNKDSLPCQQELKRHDFSPDEPNSLSTDNTGQKAGCCHSGSDGSKRYGKRVQFKASPLIVQDPFELVHNLTQNVPASTLKHIIELMRDANKICKNLNSCYRSPMKNSTSLLDLLTVCKTAKKRKHTNCHSFFVEYQQMLNAPSNIKLNSTSDIFQFIVENLEKEFGMKCERKSLAKRQCMKGCKPETLPQDFQLDCKSEELQSLKVTKISISSLGKDQVDERKEGDIANVADSHSAICTASENTWTHSHRERCKSLQINIPENDDIVEKGMTTCSSQEQPVETTFNPGKVGKLSSSKQSEVIENLNIITPPVLVFELNVISSSHENSMQGCRVSIEHVESHEFQLFGNFFTAYKKYLMALLTKESS